MLKENNEKWKLATLEEKEDCLNFMLEILNIKVVDDDAQDDIDRQLVLVNDLIARHFSSLTAPEIKEAMRMYVAKKFVDIKVFRLIDCVAIGEILTAYIEFRNQSVEPFLTKRQNLLNAPAEKTQKEKDEIFNDFVKMIYDEVLGKGYSTDAWYIFKKLEDNRKIEISNDEKLEIYKKELAVYIPEERQRIIKNHPIDFKHRLKEFEKTYQGQNKPIYVKNRCRSLMVCKFIKESTKSFDDLKNSLW
jgi:anti-anti-sigma regulatory factor